MVHTTTEHYARSPWVTLKNILYHLGLPIITNVLCTFASPRTRRVATLMTCMKTQANRCLPTLQLGPRDPQSVDWLRIQVLNAAGFAPAFFRGCQAPEYKDRERIQRAVADARLLAIPAS